MCRDHILNMRRIRFFLTSSAFLFLTQVVLLVAADKKEDQPIELTPFRVSGSFSDVAWAARFRYHIPGNALKALIFTKLPTAWIKQGINKGDILEAIDGVPIDGRSLPAVVHQLESKRNGDTPMVLDVRSKTLDRIQKVEVLLMKDSSDITIHYP